MGFRLTCSSKVFLEDRIDVTCQGPDLLLELAQLLHLLEFPHVGILLEVVLKILGVESLRQGQLNFLGYIDGYRGRFFWLVFLIMGVSVALFILMLKTALLESDIITVRLLLLIHALLDLPVGLYF